MFVSGKRGSVPTTGLRELRDSEVAIRHVRLDRDGDERADAATLSPAERRYADRGTSAVRRRRIAVRAELRRMLGEALGLPPSQVPLRTTAAGRPEVDVPGAALDVSCSASGPHGLVAVARGVRIGVDIERVLPWDDAVVDEGWLTAAEAATLQALPLDRRAEAVGRCWTRKEAILKAVGIGLMMPPGTLDAGVERERVGDWSLRPLAAPPGFIGSLACSVPISGSARVLPLTVPADEECVPA